MAKYEKWLGATLGWVITGNPLGGLLGYLAGSVTDSDNKPGQTQKAVTDFEVNLLVIASHLIRIDGKISVREIAFVNQFMNAHFDEHFSDKRAQILQHCLQKEYDLNAACGQLRNHTKHTSRLQIVQFLFELAASDGELNQRESYFIFKLAGYLNINDVDFRRIKSGLTIPVYTDAGSPYDTLGVSTQTTFAEIRTTYRKLVLKYHPDRNTHLSEAEQKKLGLKLQQIKEAYERIKAERAGS
jgi:DnaJ like chaperone protein